MWHSYRCHFGVRVPNLQKSPAKTVCVQMTIKRITPRGRDAQLRSISFMSEALLLSSVVRGEEFCYQVHKFLTIVI